MVPLSSLPTTSSGERVGLSVAGGMNNAVHTGWLPAEQTWGQLNSDTINGAAVVPPESPTSTNDATA